MFGIDWLRAGVPVDKDASVLTSEEEPVFEPSNCGCQTSGGAVAITAYPNDPRRTVRLRLARLRLGPGPSH
jgi:hypothetical protein